MLTQTDIKLLKKELKEDFRKEFATKDDLNILKQEFRKEFATKHDLQEMHDSIIQTIVEQVKIITSMIGDSSTQSLTNKNVLEDHSSVLIAHEVRIEKLEQMI